MLSENGYYSSPLRTLAEGARSEEEVSRNSGASVAAPWGHLPSAGIPQPWSGTK